MVGGGDLLFAVLQGRRDGARKPGQGKLHIRLPRSQPHIAHQNILTLDGRGGGVAADGERVGASSRLWVEPCFPIAKGIGLRRDRLAMEADGHALAGERRTPNPDRAVALQHGMIGEQTWQLYRCRRSQRKNKSTNRVKQDEAGDTHSKLR